MSVDLENLNLTELVRAGDLVCSGQAQNEPVCLTEKLCEQSRDIDAFSIFLGIGTTQTSLLDWSPKVQFVSFCGTGTNRKLFGTRGLEIIPTHYTVIEKLLQARVDVLLVQVAEHPKGGRFCLSVNYEYLAGLAKTARVVVAEVNSKTPFLESQKYYTEHDFTVLVRPAVKWGCRGANRPMKQK